MCQPAWQRRQRFDCTRPTPCLLPSHQETDDAFELGADRPNEFHGQRTLLAVFWLIATNLSSSCFGSRAPPGACGRCESPAVREIDSRTTEGIFDADEMDDERRRPSGGTNMLKTLRKIQLMNASKRHMSGQLRWKSLLLLCVVGISSGFHLLNARETSADEHQFLWVDTEDFDQYGGWTLDTQYVHLMGSAYLIAAGIGQPVEDAVTEVKVSDAGRYHVWVRARNWLQKHSPGRFQVKINGQALDKELGAASSDHWLWQEADSVELQVGVATLALHDLTGYYGRCDAIILTTDASYRPPASGWDSIPTKTYPKQIHPVQKERARLTGESLEPHHVGDFDVVVVGGGPAGGPAAIAAARMGLKTALIHDRPVLGGNGSDELGVGFNGASAHHRNARETGIIEELGRLRASYRTPNHIDQPTGQWGPGWSGAYRTLCEGEPNLTLFLNTRVFDVEMASPQRIKRAVAIDTLRGNITTYGGRQFIDCTGDGWIGVFAGAELRFGREARSEFDESRAPEEPDNITMSGCLMSRCCGYVASDTGKPAPYTPPVWAPKFTDPNTFGRKIRSISRGNWWLEHPGTIDDMGNGERARDELIRITFGYWDYVKNNSLRRAEATNYALSLVPIHVGRREGCRLVGDYILTQNDAQSGRIFPDRVAYGGWSLDVHHPQGIYSGAEGPFDYNDRVPIHTIPYRCLYSKNIENLFCPGRNMSVTHVALGTVRVQSTLATCGQAAGTAAAMCLQRDLTPRQLSQQAISDLQQQLLKDDQSIPEITNQDPADLARRATATASSEMTHSHFRREKVHVTDVFELTTTRCMSFPTPPESRVDSVFVYLASHHPKPVSLTMGLRQGATGDDFSMAKDLATATATVPPGKRSWVRFDFNQEITAPFAWVWLPRQLGTHWTLMSHAPRGSHRAYGLKSEGGVQVANGAQYMTLYTEPLTGDQDKHWAKYVNNGSIRLTNEAMNMWASDPEASLPQWIELTWDKPVTINTVYLTFDTDLNHRWHDTPRVPQCVRDYEIIAQVDGRWRVVASEEENFQRRRTHRFPAVTTNRLRVNVDATNGDASARIYEIRAYNE